MMVIGVLDHSQIGRADLDIRWFNRRDRVLANDTRSPTVQPPSPKP
jgi:hypothetical protein